MNKTMEQGGLSTLGEPMSKTFQCKHCVGFFSKYQCSATLFGECDCPKCQGFCKCNQIEKFDDFWQAWPKSNRKGAKSECKKRWLKGFYDHCADQIIKHVEWMKTTDQWRKDNGAFIPAPLVYLNQQRWDGAEVPEMPSKTAVDPVLTRMAEERSKAVPMPDHIREKLAQIRGKS